MIKIFPARESLVSDILGGNGKTANLFLQCTGKVAGSMKEMGHLHLLNENKKWKTNMRGID
jgi:hypothetical protein